MKKFTHKLAALGLSLVLSAGLLSGCGESYDPIQEAFGIPGSTVMVTVICFNILGDKRRDILDPSLKD